MLLIRCTNVLSKGGYPVTGVNCSYAQYKLQLKNLGVLCLHSLSSMWPKYIGIHVMRNFKDPVGLFLSCKKCKYFVRCCEFDVNMGSVKGEVEPSRGGVLLIQRMLHS